MIEFGQERDKSIVEISKDDKILIIKHLKEMMHSSSFLIDLINNNNLTEDMRETLLSVISFKKNDVDLLLDRNKDELKKKQERENLVRQANIKIHKLEEELRQSALNNFDDNVVADVIIELKDKIYHKWNDPKIGFGGLIDLEIKEYFAFIRFVPMFSCYSSSYSNTPDTDKKNKEIWIKELTDKGIKINKRENDLLFTDFNLKYLENVVREIVPTIQINKVRNINNFKNEFCIKDIEGQILVKDLINVFKN